MVKEEHFKRDMDVNFLRIVLKYFTDSNFIACEECFAEVFLDHLKIISASFTEIKISSELKSVYPCYVAFLNRAVKDRKHVL